MGNFKGKFSDEEPEFRLEGGRGVVVVVVVVVVVLFF